MLEPVHMWTLHIHMSIVHIHVYTYPHVHMFSHPHVHCLYPHVHISTCPLSTCSHVHIHIPLFFSFVTISSLLMVAVKTWYGTTVVHMRILFERCCQFLLNIINIYVFFKICHKPFHFFYYYATVPFSAFAAPRHQQLFCIKVRSSYIENLRFLQRFQNWSN